VSQPDDDLIHRFESGTLDGATFHHADHVRLAWSYLAHHPPEVVMQRFAEHLADVPKFHVTVTWAYVLLIADRRGDEPTFEAFAAANPDLFAWAPSVLEQYYRPETLWSERAKRRFVWPDRISASPPACAPTPPRSPSRRSS
jgi:hypothetical protein